MKLKLISGNKGKISELKTLLSPFEFECVDFELEEIQSLDPNIVISHKIQEARKKLEGDIIVEDTSLFFEALSGKLPGPYARSFLEVLKPEGLFNLTQKLGNSKATALSIIGYSDSLGNISFFEGSQEGEIVFPRGLNGFGWSTIFLPVGSHKTYGEMEQKEKLESSHRTYSTKKFKEFLEKKHE